jgi:hypothetical protein
MIINSNKLQGIKRKYSALFFQEIEYHYDNS